MERIEREVTREEAEAEYDRTTKVMNDALEKMLGEIEDQHLEAGAVIAALLKHAGLTAMALDMQREFLQALGTVAAMVANHSEQAGNSKNAHMIEGLKLTARINASANGMSVGNMVPLLVHAAVELSNEEGVLPQFIDLLAGMGKLAERMQAEGRGGKGPTKH
jgi:hypothetical protein